MRVQSKAGTGNSTTPNLTLTGGTPAPGNLLVVTIQCLETSGTVEVLTPPSGFTEIPTAGADQGGVREWFFWQRAGSSEPTAISSVIDASERWVMFAAEYHDSAGGTWSVDRASSSAGTSATQLTGTTSTTRYAAEVWVGSVASADNESQGSPANGFTQVQTGTTGNLYASLLDKIVAATGAANSSVTTAHSHAYAGGIATFFSEQGGRPIMVKHVAGRSRADRIRRGPRSKLRKPVVELIIPFPANTVAPVITGTLVVGNVLSVSNGTWTGSPTSYTYQWYRDGHGDAIYTAIPGATANTYLLTDDDDYVNLRAAVTAYNVRGNTTADSGSVGLVVEPAPAAITPPVVMGDPVIGGPLTADPGDWTNMGGYPPVTYFTYQWQRSSDGLSWTDITPLGTNAYYWPSAIDEGMFLRFCVVPHNSGQP